MEEKDVYTPREVKEMLGLYRGLFMLIIVFGVQQGILNVIRLLL